MRVALVGPLLLCLSAFGQTPTTGPSWLEHVHRNMGETSMGRSSAELGPSPSQSTSPIQVGPLALAVTLKGADLYRLKCQACHGALGEGSPPEINSIINPVRATSSTLILARMKKTGAAMSRKDAMALASQSEAALLDRLRKGGTNMPNPGLSEAEIRVLVPYLDQLAGLPAKQVTIQETAVQVGEHLVKSTCHICHAAVGPNPRPEQIGAGVIPPLGTLTSRTTLEQFVRKVTQGASVTSGALSLPARGRMPVFNYVSEAEAAAGYFYLLAYPPQ
jgi:mono/diheme cytochrome c family protein